MTGRPLDCTQPLGTLLYDAPAAPVAVAHRLDPRPPSRSLLLALLQAARVVR